MEPLKSYSCKAHARLTTPSKATSELCASSRKKGRFVAKYRWAPGDATSDLETLSRAIVEMSTPPGVDQEYADELLRAAATECGLPIRPREEATRIRKQRIATHLHIMRVTRESLSRAGLISTGMPLHRLGPPNEHDRRYWTEVDDEDE